MPSGERVTADWIQALIGDFIDTSPENTMQTGDGAPAWDDVLVGFASGADPIWQQYKEYVGAFHWTPWEVFNQHRPENNVSADRLTVISWILPQRQAVRTANRRSRKYPAEAWARIRVHGEAFNAALRRHVAARLAAAGHPAVAPMLAPNWTVVTSQRFSYASTWSERHAAHAAGLGTFGLCDGLITARGKAMRAGSVVVNAVIPPTPRPYSDHRAWCLFFAEGTCGKCIDRCPVQAITTAGHDKENVGGTWPGPGGTSKRPTVSMATAAACARWACPARPGSRSGLPGKPSSAGSCRPRRRPWPEQRQTDLQWPEGLCQRAPAPRTGPNYPESVLCSASAAMKKEQCHDRKDSAGG